MRARHPRRWTACLVALLLIGTGTACGTDLEPPARVTAEHEPVAPEDRKAEEAAAGKAALAAYAGYLTASREASARSDPHHPDLAKYLADPLLTRVRLVIREAKEHGAMRTGKLVSDPTVTVVSLDTVPATVEIQDCLDATDYKLVYAKTRKVVPGTGAGRHLATATATRYSDGRWLISAGVAHEDQPC
ncbi:hypothetical protein [Micromonospora echinospora]|uniref:hypothetical protein n=1 Tax=Micromonospora echinospora TaxID=1877 RepID=UPI00366FD0A9